MIRLRLGIFLTALLLPFLAPPSAEAFIFLRGTNYLKGERPVAQAPIWPSRSVNFFVNTNLSAMAGSNALPITSAELLASAEAAVNAWAAACRADVRVVIKGTTSATYNTSDEINVIQWDNRSTAEGNYYGTSTGTLAAATTVLQGTDFADCDIVLNGNSTTTMTYDPLAGEGDLRSVLAHEIGHCLGLDHPIEPPTYTSTDPFITDATMVQTAATGLDPSDTGRRDIAQDDRDAIECLYERGKPARTGIHCASYSGTNGQGSITGVVVGGPTVTDTLCGGDAQGRNALPSLDTGDGCVTSAVAGTTRTHAPASPLHALGGTFGFLCLIAALFFARRFSRNLRRHFALGFFLAATSIFARPARAWELELSYGYRRITPGVWNAFSSMDPGATAWDRSPSPATTDSYSEMRATVFSELTDWGKWGGALAVMLPENLETNGKAQNAAEQSKRTTLSGFRIGPDVRWFPLGMAGAIHPFVGGRFGLGLFFGSQTFTNATEGAVSYRAWAAEIALSAGAEIPVGQFRIVTEIGYSRLHSSYFASTGSAGSAYSDFPAGTRIATNDGVGTQDVRFAGTGFFGTLGLQMTFGEAKLAVVPEVESVKEPKSEPMSEPVSEPVVEPTPEVSPQPMPTGTPLADPLIEERKFQESLKPRKTWEIDGIPGEF